MPVGASAIQSHRRVSVWPGGTRNPGLTGLRRSRNRGVGGVSLHSIASANSDWLARQAHELAADSTGNVSSSGIEVRFRLQQRAAGSGQRPRRAAEQALLCTTALSQMLILCRVCPSSGGALSGCCRLPSTIVAASPASLTR